MEVHFVRSGGFAGLLIDAHFDSAALSAAEAAALCQAVDEANFFDLPRTISASGGGVDRFQYQITVEDGNRRHTVEVGESAMPETLQPLVRQLELLWRARG